MYCNPNKNLINVVVFDELCLLQYHKGGQMWKDLSGVSAWVSGRNSIKVLSCLVSLLSLSHGCSSTICLKASHD